MPGKPIPIGPFKDGLNNVSLSGEAKETELVKLVNFEVGPDASLWSRPPFEYVDNSLLSSAVTKPYKVFGVYRNSNSSWYLIIAQPQADGTTNILACEGGSLTAPVTIKSGITTANLVTAYVQVDDWAYFCVSSTSTIAGFKWRLGTAVTDVPQMKKGDCMVAYQSRLWVAGIDAAAQSSTLYFSTIDATGIQLDLWSATDFIKVAPGEGGYITALLPLNSSILVFKNDGTWRFSYPSSPKNGRVDKVSGSIGAAGPTSVVEFDNYVYVYDQGRVYELVNNNYTQINRFVKFEEDVESVDGSAPGVDLSVMNRRLILRYYNTIYSYSADSRAWSQWQSYIGTPGRLIELPANSDSSVPSTYVGASSALTQNISSNFIDAFTQEQVTYINSIIGAGSYTSTSGPNLIVTSSATGATVYLNKEGGSTGYNLKVAPGQRLQLTGTIDLVSGTANAKMTYLLRTGATTTTTTAIPNGAINITFTVPAGAILGYLSITSPTNAGYMLYSLELKRTAVSAPVTLIKITDSYNSTPVTVEYIDCSMRTKSYDYDTPAAMKRLFWWGADLKTSRYVTGKAVPVAIRPKPKWGDLQNYTHAQLQAGTFGNPLSFLLSTLTVIDGGDPANAQTENGRIFVKLKKSLRFRQISFELHMSTLGTQATGPAKIHSLTSFVLPKEKVVDRFN